MDLLNKFRLKEMWCGTASRLIHVLRAAAGGVEFLFLVRSGRNPKTGARARAD